MRAVLFAWALAVLCFFLSLPLLARDLGQWENQDPEIRRWFQTLRMPDHPDVSCCGEADAYYADTVETNSHGDLVAVITDDRPDEPLGRPHVPVGTKVLIPPYKIKWDRGNPTGHIILFLSSQLTVYCYVQNGGV